MQSFLESRWLALSTLILVIVSGACLYLWPQSWRWVLVPAVVVFGLGSVAKLASFQTPLLVASLAVFLVTAVIGYLVAYDETVAWNKYWLIVVAVLLYITITAQPVENLNILAGLALLAGVGVASYFLLTADFSTHAVKFRWIHQLGLTWMMMRPELLQLPAIHPNDAAGISIITSVFGLPLLNASGGNKSAGYVRQIIVLIALVIVLFAVVLASSRGAFLGVVGAISIWVTWRLLMLLRSPSKEKLLRLFPFLVIVGILALEVVVLFIPSGLLGSSFSLSGNVFVSRAEVFRSGLMILRDFPFTGGGLASFPGLYSQYIIVMPFYLLPHSHNMMLDVMIEQGMLGGISFVLIYLLGVRQLLSTTKHDPSTQLWYFAACLSLFTALFHGMVDDYLYGTSGPAISLMPVGMAALISRLGYTEQSPAKSEPAVGSLRSLSSALRSFGWLPAIVLVLVFAWNPIAAQWYANLGAVKMAKLDLVDYPSGQWTDNEDVSRLQSAELDFRRALVFQPDNQTANHRLGLISMSARDFGSASDHLQEAYDKDSTNRGVVKNLGYSYLWLGETEKAQSYLSRIPEARHELDVYAWWWNLHERPDLADRAAQLSARLVAQP